MTDAYRPDRRDFVLEQIRQARAELAHAERSVHQDDLMQAELDCAAAQRASRRAERAAASNIVVTELVEIEFWYHRDTPYDQGLIVRGPARSIMRGAGGLQNALREYFGRDL